jgi:hypothetical protein
MSTISLISINKKNNHLWTLIIQHTNQEGPPYIPKGQTYKCDRTKLFNEITTIPMGSPAAIQI